MANVTNLTPWKPGQSGNLNGRPVGTRTAFSDGFLKDLAFVWSEEGRETMVKTARTNPAVFFAACASLIPQDVRLEVLATEVPILANNGQPKGFYLAYLERLAAKSGPSSDIFDQRQKFDGNESVC
jgi:hypothetical protein